jgi:RNA polymerase sigma-70 factor, ECF subfamily
MSQPSNAQASAQAANVPASPDRRFVPEADAACVAAVLGGQRERFDELVARYKDAVYSVALGQVRNPHQAEDVAQDAFLNAFTALNTLRDPHYFFPWLLQIARHRATQVQRRITHRPDGVPLVDQDAAPDDSQQVQDNERLQQALGCIEQLPEPYRQTVILKYQQNKSCKEIAELEGVAVGTITSRLTRALFLLRTALTGKGEKP